MTRTVYIPLTGSEWPAVQSMFLEAGWEVYFDLGRGPDLVCFTGGSDVSPTLYGEENTHSLCDPARDDAEVKVYQLALSLGIPMVGICRGGQFLNVMNGGKMIQDIPKTWMGQSPVSGDIVIHEVKDCPVDPEGCGDATGCQGDCYAEHTVRVDHHQGMVPADEGLVTHQSKGGLIPYNIWYPSTRCLCFQPHPEWGHEPTRELFFRVIKEYIE